MSQVRVDFIGDYSDLKKKTERAEAQLERLKKKVKFQSSAMNRAFKNIAVGAAIFQLGRYAITAAQGFEKAQIASRKLGAVLESMGVEKATKRVDAYAESLQTQLFIDADIIKATQTKLATFAELNKTIGITGGAFDRATVAALDMAAAGFGTAESNAVQLGKALNDPIKGVGALTRSGITFTKAEKKKLETLVKTGKVLSAQKLILSAIEKQVSGTARAGVSSFEKLKLSVDGINDAVGEALLPVFENLAQFFVENGPTIAKSIKDLFDPTSATGKQVKDFADKLGQLATKVDEFFKSFDPDKKSSVVGFFEVLKIALDGVAFTLEKVLNLIDLLRGNNDYVQLASLDPAVRQAAAGRIAAANQELPSAPFTGANNSYTININKATMSAQDILREIQRYERVSGKKYLAK
jgi:hypothetical protein